MWYLSLSKHLVQIYCLFHHNEGFIMHCGRNFCSLRCNSKTSLNFFFLLHNFRDRRFVLTIDFSNLCIQEVFFFPY